MAEAAKPRPRTVHKAREAALELMRANLSAAADEILALQNTGVLPKGIVRQAVELLIPFSRVIEENLTRLVAQMVSRLCLEQVVATQTFARPEALQEDGALKLEISTQFYRDEHGALDQSGSVSGGYTAAVVVGLRNLPGPKQSLCIGHAAHRLDGSSDCIVEMPTSSCTAKEILWLTQALSRFYVAVCAAEITIKAELQAKPSTDPDATAPTA